MTEFIDLPQTISLQSGDVLPGQTAGRVTGKIVIGTPGAPVVTDANNTVSAQTVIPDGQANPVPLSTVAATASGATTATAALASTVAGVQSQLNTVAAAVAYVVNKSPVNHLSLTPIAGNTYANGTAGVGATLTGVSNGVLTIDGVAVVLNDRVAVFGEASPANNGIYLCTTAGASGVAYVLTRSTDANAPSLLGAACAQVLAGTQYTGWGFLVVQAAGAITIGTTAITVTAQPLSVASEAVTRAAADTATNSNVSSLLANTAGIAGGLYSNPFSIADAFGNDAFQIDAAGLTHLKGLVVGVGGFLDSLGITVPSLSLAPVGSSAPSFEIVTTLMNYAFTIEDGYGNNILTVSWPSASAISAVKIAGYTAGGGGGGGTTTSGPTKVLAGTRGAYGSQGLSNGTDTGQNTRIAVVVPGGASSIELEYGNVAGQSENTLPGNAISVSAAIEYPVGTLTPVYQQNARPNSIPNGLSLRFDPVELDIPPGATIYIRTYVSVASAGMKWPIGQLIRSGDGYNSGASQSDQTLNAAFSYGNSVVYAFGPAAVIAYQRIKVPSILIVGDSIATGTGDSQSAGLTGFITDALGTQFPYSQVSCPGELASNFQGDGKLQRMLVAKYATTAIVEYGTNDIFQGNGLGVVQNNLINIWSALNTRGAKVFQTTILPRTSSTDTWETSGNQTPISGFATGGTRSQLNAWIRAGAPITITAGIIAPAIVGQSGAILAGATGHPLQGYFETANFVETAQDSGLWQSNGTANYLTGDGIHPSAVGHQLAKAGIVLSSLQ